MKGFTLFKLVIRIIVAFSIVVVGVMLYSQNQFKLQKKEGSEAYHKLKTWAPDFSMEAVKVQGAWNRGIRQYPNMYYFKFPIDSRTLSALTKPFNIEKIPKEHIHYDHLCIVLIPSTFQKTLDNWWNPEKIQQYSCYRGKTDSTSSKLLVDEKNQVGYLKIVEE